MILRPLLSTLFPYTTLFRSVIHLVFLAACTSIFFDPKYSPRALVTNVFGLSFLSFYYLAALSVGYFVGYVDRKSTRLNSSHVEISYAVFCLKKKNNNIIIVI